MSPSLLSFKVCYSRGQSEVSQKRTWEKDIYQDESRVCNVLKRSGGGVYREITRIMSLTPHTHHTSAALTAKSTKSTYIICARRASL